MKWRRSTIPEPVPCQ